MCVCVCGRGGGGEKAGEGGQRGFAQIYNIMNMVIDLLRRSAKFNFNLKF